MQCSCGGSTAERQAVRHLGDKKLRYQECGSCGRVGEYRLTMGDVLVAIGREAQRRFSDATITPNG